MAKNTYLRQFLENLDDIVFVIDFHTLTYKYISPSIKSRGVTPEEVYADPSVVYEMLDEDYRQSLLAKVRENINKGSVHFEYPVTIQSGEVKWYSSLMFLVDENEGEQMLAGIIRDITGQKQTELTLEQLKLGYEDLYDNAPIGYHSLDKQGNFVRINDTELKWLGYTREELLGKFYPDAVLTPASREKFQVTFPKFKDQGFINDLRMEMARKDGRIMTGLIDATWVREKDGEFVASRSSVTDISKMVEAEEKLRLKQLELETANEMLRQSNQKLEHLNFTKDVLLKIVSHDLRNPIVTINLMAELLNERNTEIDAGALQTYLSYIKEASDQANQILSDLTGIISLDSDDVYLNFAKIDLAAVIEEAIGINTKKADEKGIKLYIAENPTQQNIKVRVDAKWMVRALDNIIANAIKFSNKGGEVKITCRQVAQKLVLSIADKGIGIPKAMLQKLFEKRVVQSRQGTAGETGTGLGLSIVKQIMDMQVGEISVKSREGAGSTFEIKLPIAN